MTFGGVQRARSSALWVSAALLAAVVLAVQADSGLLVLLGALAGALAAIGLHAVATAGRSVVPGGPAVAARVGRTRRHAPARQHDPDAAGRARPRAPGRARSHG